MNISLEHLKAFVVFAQSKNMVEAAASLKITQANLSFILKKLEQDLKFSPFSFQGKKKVLNQYGHALLASISPLIDEMDRNIRKVDFGFLDPKQSVLRISGKRELLKRFLQNLSFPGQLHLKFMSPEQSLAALEARQVDLAIIQKPKDSFMFNAKLLFQDNAYLGVSNRMHSGKLNAKIISQFPYDELPCVAYNASLPILKKFCDLQKWDHKKLKIIRYCDDWSFVAHYVESGQAWSVLPSSQNIKNVNQFMISSDQIPSKNFYLVYHKEFAKIEWFQNLLKQIIEGANG